MHAQFAVDGEVERRGVYETCTADCRMFGVPIRSNADIGEYQPLVPREATPPVTGLSPRGCGTRGR